MNTIIDLHELFIHELQDLYNAKLQESKALEGLKAKASSEVLRQLMERSASENLDQTDRLKSVAGQLGTDTGGAICEAMKGLIQELHNLLSACEDPEVCDAALISALQRISHYEIAAYGALCSYARKLGYKKIANYLHQSLEEEKRNDRELADLAKTKVNQRAVESTV